MSDCPHLLQEKVVDRLGLMTEKPDGTVSAPVLEWSIRCADCGVVLFVAAEAYGDGRPLRLDEKRPAAMKAEPPPSTSPDWIRHTERPAWNPLSEIKEAVKVLLGRKS